MTSCQHADDFDKDEVKKLLGPDRAAVIASMTSQERFAETVNGMTFEVYGLTYTLNKMKDFKRIMAFLQTISGSEVLAEEFAREYSFSKLLMQIMKALDINANQLKLGADEKAQVPTKKPLPVPGSGPNVQSQIPQSASDKSGPAATGAAPIPFNKFPPSRASG
jgi:hypothetical protein